MKNYQKPMLKESNILMEGVYAGSGDEGISSGKCSKGRCFNTQARKCRECNGGYVASVPATYCPEGKY